MSTFKLSHLILDDQFPGVPNPNLGIPTGGWDNTTDNFNTSDATTLAWDPPYPVGTKIMAYTDNSHCPGYYTMAYLMYHDWCTQNISAEDISLGTAFCFHYEGSEAQAYASRAADSSEVPWYVVSKCYTAATDVTEGVGGMAIPCATISCDGTGVYCAGTGDSYGWFWVGGVCPCADATLLQGTGSATAGPDISCDTLCRTGTVMMEMTAAIGWLMNTDLTNFGDSTAFTNVKAQNIRGIGYLCTSCV